MLWTKEAPPLSEGYAAAIVGALVFDRKNVVEVAFAIQVCVPARMTRATAEAPRIATLLAL